MGALFYAPFDTEHGSNVWTRGKGFQTAPSTETVDADGTFVAKRSRLITPARANVLRVEQLGALLEGTRTNICKQSEDFATTWSDVNGTVDVASNAEVAPDGNTTADTLTDNAAGVVEGIRNNSIVVVDDSNPFVASIYVKATTSATTFPTLRIGVSGGATVQATVNFDTNDGTFTNHATQIPDSAVSEREGDYWRIQIRATNDSSGNTTGFFDIFPASDEALSGVPVGSVTVWGAQFEQNATFASSYIPTTTGSVARTAEDIDYIITDEDLVTAPDGAFGGVVTPEYDGADVGADAYVFDLSTANDGLRGFFDQSNDGKFTVIVDSGGAPVATLVAASAPSRGVSFDFFVTWRNGDFVLYKDGVPEATDTGGAAPTAVGTHVFLGQTRGNASQGFINFGQGLLLERDPGAGVIGQIRREMRLRAAA